MFSNQKEKDFSFQKRQNAPAKNCKNFNCRNKEEFHPGIHLFAKFSFPSVSLPVSYYCSNAIQREKINFFPKRGGVLNVLKGHHHPSTNGCEAKVIAETPPVGE